MTSQRPVEWRVPKGARPPKPAPQASRKVNDLVDLLDRRLAEAEHKLDHAKLLLGALGQHTEEHPTDYPCLGELDNLLDRLKAFDRRTQTLLNEAHWLRGRRFLHRAEELLTKKDEAKRTVPDVEGRDL
jgi:uncharacterized membrane protein YccC